MESGAQQALCGEPEGVLLGSRIAGGSDDGTGCTIGNVADGIVARLARRHPHVFGNVRSHRRRGHRPLAVPAGFKGRELGFWPQIGVPRSRLALRELARTRELS